MRGVWFLARRLSVLETVCRTRCLFLFSLVWGVDAGNAQTWIGVGDHRKRLGRFGTRSRKRENAIVARPYGGEDADRIGSDQMDHARFREMDGLIWWLKQQLDLTNSRVFTRIRIDDDLE